MDRIRHRRNATSPTVIPKSRTKAMGYRPTVYFTGTPIGNGGWPDMRSRSRGRARLKPSFAKATEGTFNPLRIEKWCECRESNPDHQLRRRIHYPLCYTRKKQQRVSIRRLRGISSRLWTAHPTHFNAESRSSRRIPILLGFLLRASAVFALKFSGPQPRPWSSAGRFP